VKPYFSESAHLRGHNPGFYMPLQPTDTLNEIIDSIPVEVRHSLAISF